MVKNDEHQILQIIKYTPPLVILIASMIITILIYSDYSRTLEVEKEQIQEEYIREQKEIIKQNVNIAINYIHMEEQKTSSSLKIKLKHQISNAKTIINSIYEKNKNTKSKKEITALIKDALREIRFNQGRGYFFIFHENGESILHPIFPESEGENYGFLKTNQGVELFKLFKNSIKDSKGTYTQYDFFHPLKKSEEKNKLIYAEKFAPYNWIIGTGEYTEDFENEIKDNIIYHLANTHLGENRYYIILDYKGTFVSHPRKEFQDKNIYKDKYLKKFIPIFEKMKNVITAEKGYYENHLSLKPDTNKPSPKTYYAKIFPKWKWIVTTGFYKEDIESLVKENEIYLEKKYTGYLNTIIYSSFFITVLLLLVSFYVAQILEKKFLRYKKRLEEKVTQNVKQKNILKKAQTVAKIGDWELNLNTMKAYWSEQILNIFGLKKDFDEAGPEYLKRIMHKDDIAGFEKSLKDSVRFNQEHKAIYRITRPDGTLRWIDCRGHFNKSTNTMAGVIQDITDSKTLELDKLHKEELLYQQSKMAAMGEMIGNIAHQWRQPLSSITTAATGVKLHKELGILKDEDFTLAMDTINNKAQYLSNTIDDFRDFYKPNREKNIFSVKTMLDKTITLLDAQFKAKEIEVVKEIEDFELETLENELIQVVINVLNNARDALIQKDDSKRLIFIKTYNQENAFHISIWDNAGGIKKKILNRIFEPYFTTKHKSQGTGIGLFMSEEIMSKHLNGNINARNKHFVFEEVDYIGAEFNIVIYKDIEQFL